MADRITIGGGQVTCVYDDRFLPLLKALGKVEIIRATDVEYYFGEWIATLRATGEIIARGQSRDEVIKEEVKWLEDHRHVAHRESGHQVQEY